MGGVVEMDDRHPLANEVCPVGAVQVACGQAVYGQKNKCMGYLCHLCRRGLSLKAARF
jgi:hypothetical protein